MTDRLKWTLVALLGFSTACSATRHAKSQDKPEPAQQQESTFRTMYGVRRAEEPTTPPDSIRREDEIQVIAMYGVRMPEKKQ